MFFVLVGGGTGVGLESGVQSVPLMGLRAKLSLLISLAERAPWAASLLTLLG